MPWWGWILIGAGVIILVLLKVVVAKKFLQFMKKRKEAKEEILDE